MATNCPTTILIVDDEPKNIQLLANMLNAEGYAIEYATSGLTALRWVKQRSFDLILLDILMPEMDGFEICRQIKGMNGWSEVPVIFLTARADSNSLATGFELGAADYVTKPFQKEELIARVNAHVTMARQRSELQKNAALLEEKARLLERENEHKDRLISILAHDLRNPLAGILDYARLLREAEHLPPGKLNSLAVDVQVTTGHLLELVDNLLAWSHIQRGLITPHPQWVLLRQSVQARLELLSVNAAQKKINLVNQVNHQLRAWCDVDMLGIVLDNLISNAIKFTSAGGRITINAWADQTMIQVEVHDSGVGIPQEQLVELFKPGANVHTIGTAGERGTGLGLMLVKELTEANRGTVWVESQPGTGSRFYFTLPATGENYI